MASAPSLLTPSTATATATAGAGPRVRHSPTSIAAAGVAPPQSAAARSSSSLRVGRRDHLAAMSAAGLLLLPTTAATPAHAASDEDYVRDTSEMIGKVRSTINMDRGDPNVAEAVAELREASNNWVSKYRKEKVLLGRASFRDIYSALNAVSGHYISFGPTAPIPAKRKARILEEVSGAEKALLRGR